MPSVGKDFCPQLPGGSLLSTAKSYIIGKRKWNPARNLGEGETRERMVCMAGQNKVRVEICGSRYVVSSNEPVEYVKRLANTIESKVKTYMDSSPNVTLTDAYFLALLSYADLYEKSEQNADHIRSQLTEYLEDSTRAKLEIDQYKRENERLKKEIDILRQNIGREP